MIATAAEIVTMIGVPFALGMGLLRLLGVRAAADRMAWCGWAFASGSLVAGLVLFAWSWTGLGYARVAVVPVLAGVTALLFLAARKRRAAAPCGARREPSGVLGAALVWATLLAMIALAIVRAAEANERVIVAGDEASIWAAKAKALHTSGGFNEAFRVATGERAQMHHKDYPLLIPLLMVWAYSVADETTDVENRIPIQAGMLALLIVAAAALRARATAPLAALGLFLLGTCQTTGFLSRYAHADHWVALGFVMAMDGWLRARAGWRPGWTIAVLGLAVMIWSKNEGFLLVAAIAAGVVAALALRAVRFADVLPPRRIAAAGLLILGGLVALHVGVNRHFGFVNDLTQGHGGPPLHRLIVEQFGDRWRVIASHFAGDFFWRPIDTWPIARTPSGSLAHRFSPLNGILGALLLCCAGFPQRLLRRDGELAAPALTIAAAICGFFLIYAGSFQELDWHLATSSARVLYGVTPAAAVVLAAALSRLLARKRLHESDASIESSRNDEGA